MTGNALADYRDRWRRKPVLRAVYEDYYHRLAAACRPGPTLEIGGGSGNLKEFLPEVISTDIQWAPWLDAVADAQRLPFADGSFANVVLFDVLHHIERPVHFFREARRVLAPGGRVVMIEPGITPVSRLMYGLGHEEPVDLAADPFVDDAPTPGRDPYEANQAVPTLMFKRCPDRFRGMFPDLRILRASWLSLVAYPLSGGFRTWSTLPASWARPVLALEDRLMALLGPMMAFRLFVVIEKSET